MVGLFFRGGGGGVVWMVSCSVIGAGMPSSVAWTRMCGMRVVRWSELWGKFWLAVSVMSLLRVVSVSGGVSAGRMRFPGLVLRVCWMVAGMRSSRCVVVAMSVRMRRAVMAVAGLGLLRPV